MSGITGHTLGHIVRRGVAVANEQFFTVTAEQLQKLQQDAQLYEDGGLGSEIKPYEMLPVLVTFVIFALIIASVRYTIGEVVASLAMIESSSSTPVIESKPPAYADEPDAPLEKEPLIPARADSDRDVEVTVIKHKPVTAKITTTIGHLQRVGGFRARWRGLGLAILYHALHGVVGRVLSSFVGHGLLANALVYIFVSVALSRFHMLWTHALIAHPTSKRFWRRVVPRKQCKAILLPSLVFATAQQATMIAPMAVAFALGMPQQHLHHLGEHGDCARTAFEVLRFLAVPATALFVALAVLLPASVTLIRIEAALLPEDQEAIVPFDRKAILGSVNLSERGGSRSIFVQAWRSFDRAARVRIIKLYAKMVLIQVTIVIIALHLMVAEVYVIGGERLGRFIRSGAAQLQLMVVEGQENL